ncbi:hypothetical protein OC842_004654 [Tilletia horrida]|uniref:Eisosome component PIL1-domain-containing protein n=1 Tax=Tilletia horrida TaxID=155126 RepID=A0AAN6JJ42_9BASI|nr:hypothetical protein OC842_004654 [Tilletia horrida]
MFAKAKQGLAHNTVAPTLLGNRDLKLLQSIITTEKEFVKSHTRAGADFKETADALKGWADAEGPDLGDALGKLSTLFHQYDAGVERYNAHVGNIRLHFKSIRTREEGLADLKARKRALAARIDSLEKKLAKMGPENKQLMQTTGQLKDSRNEMISMEAEVRSEEAALGDFKRRTARDAITLKCGGLQELAEKLLIIAASGRLLVDQIPTRVTPPGGPRADYNGWSRTDQVLQDALQSISNVSFRLGSTVTTDPTGALASIPDAGSYYDAADETNSQNHPIYAQHASSIAAASPPMPTEVLGQPPQSNVDSSVTPIAARFASTSTPAGTGGPGGGGDSGAGGGGHQSSLSTDGYKDVAADEWGKAAGLALAGASGRVSTPPAGTDASGTQSFWRDVDPVHEANISVANKVSLTTATASPASIAQSFPGAPNAQASGPSADVHVETVPAGARLPRLQVVNITPSPEDERPSRTALNTGETRNQFSSNTATDRDFDRSYFTEIGSTRALQESVRRPTSPPGGSSPAPSNRFANVAPASPSMAAANAYEPPEGGRKMSAAAFKRGFARNASAQSVGYQPGGLVGGSSSVGGGGDDGVAGLAAGSAAMTPTASYSGGAGGYGATKPEDIEPLHIRKRFSVTSANVLNTNSRIAAEEGTDDAAPPYAPAPANGNGHGAEAGLGAGLVAGGSQPHPSSIYGGLDGLDHTSAAAQYTNAAAAADPYQQQQHATPWATPMSHGSPNEYPQAAHQHYTPARTQLPPGGW